MTGPRFWWIEGDADAAAADRLRPTASPSPDRRPGQANPDKLAEWRAQLVRRAGFERRGSGARKRTEAQLRKLTTQLLRLELSR